MSIAKQREKLFGHAPETNFLTESKGWASWLCTLDHKRIGIMYLIGVMGAFCLAGIFALILRIELFTPGQMFLGNQTYNRMFTLHGAIMVFVFIIPSIPAALGNFVLPVMLGAKDVAFPRLNLASFYLWMGGTFFFIVSMVSNALDTGWTFYTPYSVQTSTAVIAATTGVFILGFSSIFTGLNFIVTVNTMRPPGMTWFKMPLMLWALYSTAIIQVLATPVLAITGLLLMAERIIGLGIFDPALGGDPVLFQHFFWFYSHPAVYIMILPAMGIISELIAVHAQKKIFGYDFIAYSSIAIALLSFLVWGHHMFTSGQSEMVIVIFSALTFSVAIPSAVKVFNWVATLYKGSIALTTPMCYALSFIFLFGIGGLTGLPLGTLSTDIHLHDTYFVVAHFHYVMVGGTLIAFLGGLFHWWPKMFGRMYNERGGQWGALLVFVGFNVTFFPQFIMGSRGMPRRYARYDPEYQIFHQLSTIGAIILGIGLLIAGYVLITSLYRGKRAPGNPWGAATLEFQCCSPPTFHNFEHDVIVNDPYDYSSIEFDEKVDGYVPVEPAPAEESAPNPLPAETT
ncbi:cbb3-type cytochrome c oxidase subunit I [Mariniblastus sp.]|jgi:cytochrome c oxidase subunit I|nr:cbb3-type cytochrome c oxidase subunit I [Mariniblastus sp.]MDB4756557.1 cbb3-type cytochrome c oxidase subunit I [Mariniblastus sp.]